MCVIDNIFDEVEQKETETSPAPLKEKDNIKKNITEVILKENPEIEIRFNAFCEWLKNECPFVLKVKKQMTMTEYFKVRYFYTKSYHISGDRYTTKELQRALSELNNWADFPKKRTTVYLSVLEQLERNNGKRENISS